MGYGSKIDTAMSAGIALIIIMISMLAMTTIVIDQIETATENASTWNFTGASGAEALLGLVPFVWIAGIVLLAIVGSFLIARSLGSKH